MPGTFAEMTRKLAAGDGALVPPQALRLVEAGYSFSESLEILTEAADWQQMKDLAMSIDVLVPPDDVSRPKVVAALGDVMQAIEDQSPRRTVMGAQVLRKLADETKTSFSAHLAELADHLQRFAAKEGLGKRREGGTRAFSRMLGLEILDWMGHQVKPRIGMVIDAFDDFYRREDIRASIQFLIDARYLARSGAGASSSWFVPTERGLSWYRRKWAKKTATPAEEDAPLMTQESLTEAELLAEAEILDKIKNAATKAVEKAKQFVGAHPDVKLSQLVSQLQKVVAKSYKAVKTMKQIQTSKTIERVKHGTQWALQQAITHAETTEQAVATMLELAHDFGGTMDPNVMGTEHESVNAASMAVVMTVQHFLAFLIEKIEKIGYGPLSKLGNNIFAVAAPGRPEQLPMAPGPKRTTLEALLGLMGRVLVEDLQPGEST